MTLRKWYFLNEDLYIRGRFGEVGLELCGRVGYWVLRIEGGREYSFGGMRR